MTNESSKRSKPSNVVAIPERNALKATDVLALRFYTLVFDSSTVRKFTCKKIPNRCGFVLLELDYYCFAPSMLGLFPRLLVNPAVEL